MTKTTTSVKKNNKHWLRRVANILPFCRLHEVALFVVYGLVGWWTLTNTQEACLILIWLSFVMSISFMEAWVKFRAPFLRKHVAVDVGRHVFRALHAVEWGLATAFWYYHYPVLRKDLTSTLLYPTIATACLVVLSCVVQPILSIRTKTTILENSSILDLTRTEAIALDQISQDIQGVKCPGPQWHILYVFLETIKATSLGVYFILSNAWLR